MATFTELVKEYTGDIPSGFQINNALYEGVLDVMEKTKVYFPHELYKYTTKELIPEGGLDVLNTGSPVYVERDGFNCTEISPRMVMQAKNSASIHYRTKEDPAFYIDAGIVTTVPATAGTVGGFTSTEDYLGNGTDTAFNCISAHNLSVGQMVLIISASGAYNNSGNPQEVTVVVDSDTFVTAHNPAASEGGAFTENVSYAYILKPGSNATSLGNVDSTSTGIEKFPRNRYNAVVLFASRKVIMTQITDIMDSLSLIAKQYPKDVVSAFLPQPPSVPAITELANQTSSIDMFVSPNRLELPTPPQLNQFNIDISGFDVPEFSTIVTPGTPNFDDTTANLSSIEAPVYLAPVSEPIDFSKVKSYIQDTEDVELAQMQLQDAQAKIAAFQGNVQNQNSAYNARVEKYKTLVQEELAKIQHKNKVELDNYSQSLSKYQSDVQNATQSYSSKLSKLNAEVQNHISAVSTEHKFNLDQYSAEVSSAIGKAQQDLNGENQRLQAGISKFNAEVSQVEQSNKTLIEKFNSEISDYQAKVQANLGKYNADVQKHTAEVQKITSKYQNIVTEHQAKTNLLESVKREYNEVFNILPQEDKTPAEQRRE